MAKVFEDEFMDVQSGLIDLCMEVSNGNVDKIYAYCAVGEYSLMFHAFFMVNGKITRLHDLEGMTEGLESEFLHVGTGDLNLLRDLGKKYNRPIPAEIKLYYDVPSGKFHAEYDYNPAFVKNRRVGPEDTFRAWRDEMAGIKRPFWKRK